MLCSRLYHFVWLVGLLVSICWSDYLSLISCIIPKEKLTSTANLLKLFHGVISENYFHVYIALEMNSVKRILTATSPLLAAIVYLATLGLFLCVIWNWKIMRVFFIPKRTGPLRRAKERLMSFLEKDFFKSWHLEFILHCTGSCSVNDLLKFWRSLWKKNT